MDLELKSLDVPPAPPDILEKPPEPPKLPQQEEAPELPPLAEFPSIESNMPAEEFNAPPIEPVEPQEPFESKEPEPPKPLFRQQIPEPEAKPEIPKPTPDIDIGPIGKHYQRVEMAAVREEKDVLAHKKEVKGPIYLRADKFKKILTGISVTRNDLKMIDDSIVKLNQLDEQRDKEFEKWRNVVSDMQKKFIFIEKTIFKR